MGPAPGRVFHGPDALQNRAIAGRVTLVRMLLLLPADPLSPRRPDPHWADEAAAAQQAGHAVALVDHDAIEAGRAEEAVQRVPAEGDVVYRGWMMTATQYASLAQALAARGASLRTSAAAYRRAHELPGWYEALAAFTPASAWSVGDDLGAFDRCCAQLGAGPAVLRDYTKSLKHHWDEAAYIADAADQAGARRIAERFRQLRDDAFMGGFVVRRFERFVGAETRTWWRDGRCVLQTAHPDTPTESPAVPASVRAALGQAVAGLGLPFVTIDMVRRDDGAWRLVELGDGQVSDRPASCAAGRLVAALDTEA